MQVSCRSSEPANVPGFCTTFKLDSEMFSDTPGVAYPLSLLWSYWGKSVPSSLGSCFCSNFCSWEARVTNLRVVNLHVFLGVAAFIYVVDLVSKTQPEQKQAQICQRIIVSHAANLLHQIISVSVGYR